MFELIAYVMFLHWFGDFVCQTRWMADNKSKNLIVLTLHVLTYSVVLAVGLIIFRGSVNNIFKFAIVNFCLHWMTDIITSQFTKHFYAKQDYHKFFATIGFDQLMHQIFLLFTIKIFLS